MRIGHWQCPICGKRCEGLPSPQWRLDHDRSHGLLTVRYRGGSLDGHWGTTDDDQVPQHIVVNGERYCGVERYYIDGMLVEITYEYDDEAGVSAPEASLRAPETS